MQTLDEVDGLHREVFNSVETMRCGHPVIMDTPIIWTAAKPPEIIISR